MKPIAIFVLVAAVSLAAVAASAKTVTAPGNMDERVISQVAGPKAAAETSKRQVAASSDKPASQQRGGEQKAQSKPLHDHD